MTLLIIILALIQLAVLIYLIYFAIQINKISKENDELVSELNRRMKYIENR